MCCKRRTLKAFNLQVLTPIPSQVEDTADVTVGGVILPEAAKERPLIGTVVTIGPGKWDKENPGQRKPMIVSVPSP